MSNWKSWEPQTHSFIHVLSGLKIGLFDLNSTRVDIKSLHNPYESHQYIIFNSNEEAMIFIDNFIEEDEDSFAVLSEKMSSVFDKLCDVENAIWAK